jgi:lactoylglutathione lyase
MRLSILLTLLPAALACGPSNDASNDGSFILGPEGSDPETVGYFVNHFSLNVNNLTRSIEFYTEVFGMRHIFTSYLTEHISFTYLGTSSGGRNGSGYQTTEELLRYKNNAQGMIELVHLNITRDSLPSPAKQVSTFNHVGIIVPDTTAAQERLERYGVEIYKRVGAPLPEDGPLADAEVVIGDVDGLSEEEWQAFRKAMTQLNSLNIFAADPDGNLLEILPMDEQGLFG